MAISKKIPGLKVSIRVGGEAAEEYDPPYGAAEDGQVLESPPEELDPDLPHDYIVKYIEAKTGAPFVFRVETNQLFRRFGHHLTYQVEVDGTEFRLIHQKGHATDRPALSNRWKATTSGCYAGSLDNPPRLRVHFFRFEELTMGKSYAA